MGKKTFKTTLKDGTRIKVRRMDNTYDNFDIYHEDSVGSDSTSLKDTGAGGKQWVLNKSKADIYDLMNLSTEVYEHFKASQRGTTVGELYNN